MVNVLNFLSMAKSAKTVLPGLKSLDRPLLALAGFAEKHIPSKALASASALVTVVTGGCMLSSAAQHQEEGGILNVLEGIADCSSEGYYKDGADQSGTMCTSIGQILRSVAINGFNLAMCNSNLLAKLAPKHIKVLGYVSNALFAAEVASMADEAFRGDGDRVKDKADLLDNGLNMIGLAMSRKNLLGARGFRFA